MDFTMARLHTALGLIKAGAQRPEILPPKDPVWVGREPGIKFNSEDRWGCLHPWPYGTYYVTEPGMIERERFLRLLDYQTPVDFSKMSCADRALFSAGDFTKATEESEIGREVKRKLSLPYGHRPSTVWEMNVVVPAGSGSFDLMRMMEGFGERTIVPWTGFDLLFRYPMLVAQTRRLNIIAATERERLGPEAP